MGFYEDGTVVSGDELADMVVQGLIEYGPGDVVRQIKEVNNFLKIVDGDIQADVKVTGNDNFLKTWRDEVYLPWKEFYADFNSAKSASPSRFRDSTYRRAEAYRQLGMRFRENLQKKSTAEVTDVRIPEPIKVPKEQDRGKIALPDQSQLPDTASSRNMGTDWLKWILAGVGIVGGGYMVYKFWPKSSEQVLDTNQNNPPDWVKADDIGKWERAVNAVKPDWHNYENPYAVVTHVYKNMGGHIVSHSK